MGVPKFYKWLSVGLSLLLLASPLTRLSLVCACVLCGLRLSERYPLINQVATTDIRPEFDNLYLDMNGIIHNCSHGDSHEEGVREKALTEAQILTNVFKYLEKLFSIAQPKQLLYMAIDGVAPRAKMNQQRQRRFRAAKDAREAMEIARGKGEDVDPTQVFDSNCITPGTDFMVSLSGHIRYFIRKKMKEDAAWQKIKVIFSGAEVPGEGEHKIMLYIRNMKSQSGYNPNTRHVLYGLDADLVMLSLVSHDPHFSLLREEVVFGNNNLPRKVLKKMDEFQFLHISLLREYLDLEFRSLLLSPDAATPLPFEYSLERLIDDWVILAFFVGNDFLPHLPTLDIGEGGLDTLFQIYREELPTMGGYIFDQRQIHWKRLEAITRRMGMLEEEVFAERQSMAIEYAKKQKRNERRNKPVLEINENELFDGEAAEASPSPDPDLVAATLASLEMEEKKQPAAAKPIIFDSQLKMLMKGREKDAKGDAIVELDEHGRPLDYESMSFKSRYYREKFPEFFDGGMALLRENSGTERKGTSGENIRQLVQNYTQGLQWVAQYYYEGCRSWKWFFAYRYAPLASDMVDLDQLDLTVPLGYPFRPMEQLLGVLPPASGRFLPAAYRALMDPRTSPVADFYPLDFSIDMNGKRSAWEGIALIPFIEEARLLKALSNISQSQLSATEQKRNQRYGDEYLFEYDPESNATIPATNGAFANIVDCHSRETVYRVPSIPMTPAEQQQRAQYEAETLERAKTDPTILPVPSYYAGNFQPQLCPGVHFPCQGYPSLQTSVAQNQSTIDASLQKIGVNVFGMDSKKDSLVLKVARSAQAPPAPAGPALAKKFINQRVFVDWPYLKEALVVGLTDATHIWTTSGGRQMTSGESATHRTECTLAMSKLMQNKAVDVGTVTTMLSVQMFTGMKRSSTGAIKRAFSDKAVWVPLQLVFAQIPNPDPRYVELPPPSIADAFPIGAAIVYTGPQHYGSIGSIVAHSPDKKTVSVKVTVQPPEASFGRAIAASSQLQYYPSYLVSKSLQIHPLVLSKICSSVYVQQERTDIGLKLKFAKQSLQVPEYARRVDAWSKAPAPAGKDAKGRNNNAGKDDSSSSSSQQGNNEGWEYSEKAIALLAAYKRRFPLLFEMMNAEPNTFKYDASALVQASPADGSDLSNPRPEKTPSDAIKEIENWLKTVGINNLLLIPCNSLLMAERGVKAVEQESSRLTALRDAAPTKEIVLNDVPIFHLYRPDPVVAWSPTETDLPQLGDRVLSIRSDAGAPFALRGTVVCVHMSRHAEIVFDREFMSGNHLNHKCSNLRGQTLALTSFINLTTPKVLAPKNTQAAATPAAASVPKQILKKPAEAAAQPQQQQQQKPQPPRQQPAPQPQSARAAASSSAAPAASVPMASAAAAAPLVDPAAASSALKQMLNIGGTPSAGPAIPSVYAPMPGAAPAPAVASAPVDPNADPMENMLAKSKARRAKPAATGPSLPVILGQPMPMQYMAGPPPGAFMQGPPFMGPPMMQGPPPFIMHQGPPQQMQQPPAQQQQQQPPQQ